MKTATLIHIIQEPSSLGTQVLSLRLSKQIRAAPLLCSFLSMNSGGLPVCEFETRHSLKAGPGLGHELLLGALWVCTFQWFEMFSPNSPASLIPEHSKTTTFFYLLSNLLLQAFQLSPSLITTNEQNPSICFKIFKYTTCREEPCGIRNQINVFPSADACGELQASQTSVIITHVMDLSQLKSMLPKVPGRTAHSFLCSLLLSSL